MCVEVMDHDIAGIVMVVLSLECISSMERTVQPMWYCR